MPIRGLWHAEVGVDTSVLVDDATMTLRGPSLALKGTTYRGGIYAAKATVRMVAGAGGLAKVLPATSYFRVQLRHCVEDILREAGEVLSSTSEAAVLDIFIDRWTRPRGSGADALATLLDAAPKASWRALDDGTIWVGTDAWPTLDVPYQVLSEDPAAGRLVVATETPFLRPGVTLDGRRITRVDHVFDDSSVRSELDYTKDPEHGSVDRLLDSFAKVVRRVMRSVRMHARRVGTILRQESNGAVTVKLDGEELTGNDFIPLRYGLPGFKAKVPAGTRCAVHFDEGDPNKPVVSAFEGEAVTEIAFDGGTKPVARVDDTADAGHLVVVGSPVTGITYFAPGTLPTPAPPGAVIALTAKITSGNTKFKA